LISKNTGPSVAITYLIFSLISSGVVATNAALYPQLNANAGKLMCLAAVG